MKMPTCTAIFITFVVILCPWLCSAADLCKAFSSLSYPDSFEYEPKQFSLPVGSLIIPMDSLQSLSPLPGTLVKFNLYVYGAIAALRRAHVPVEWIIKKHALNETGDDVADLRATVSQCLPTPSPDVEEKIFYNGPFAVQAKYKDLAISVLANLTAITDQTRSGWGILVYITTAPTTAPIRYHIDTRVNLAVSSSMGFSGIVENYLRFSGFVRGEDYDVMEFSNSVVNETTCYSTLVEPYSNDKDYYTNKYTDAFYNQLTTFLKSGGNVIASGTAAIHYERKLKLIIQDGSMSYNSTNYSLDYTFIQPQSPISQLNSANIISTSLVNTFYTTSTFNKLSYELIKNSDNNYKALGGRISSLAANNFYGSNLYYLSGNKYNSNGVDDAEVNGVRMFLNAVMIPSTRPQTISACEKSFTYEADLTVSVTAPSIPEKRAILVYSISVNCSACYGDCFGASAMVVFPSESVRIEFNGNERNCSISGTQVMCNFGRVPSGTVATKSVRVTALTYANGTTINTTAILAPFVTDANPANNYREKPYIMNNFAPEAVNDFSNVTATCSEKKVYYWLNDKDRNSDVLVLNNITGDCLTGKDDVGNFISYNGGSTCNYWLNDSITVSNMAAVTYTVLSPSEVATPKAQLDNFIMEPDGKLFNLLSNDVFTCIDDISMIYEDPVEFGNQTSSTFVVNKWFYYEPASPVVYGNDFFRYSIKENGKTSPSVEVGVVVVPRIRILTNTSYSVNEDSVLIVNITENANSVEGRYFSLQSCEKKSDLDQGKVECELRTGKITYTPYPNVNTGSSGSDIVRFSTTNGVNTLNGAFSVTILPVEDPVVAVDDYYVINEDIAITFDVNVWVDNDIDVDDFDELSLSINMPITPSQPTNGTLTYQESDGIFIYSPSPDYHGVDSFTYTVTDGSTESSGTVFITVLSVYDYPRAFDDTTTIAEDDGVHVIPILYHDYLVDSYDIIVTTNLTSDYGQISGRDIQFSAPPNVNGLVRFTYTVQDRDVENSATEATVLVVILPVNDSPTADNFSISLQEGEARVISVAPYVADVDMEQEAPVLNYTRCNVLFAVQQCDIIGNDTIQFTPKPHFYGTTIIDYNVKDVEGAISSTGKITVEVNNVEDLPIARDDVILVYAFTIAEIYPLQNDYDYDDQDTLLIDSFVVEPFNGVDITELFTLVNSKHLKFNTTSLGDTEQHLQINYVVKSGSDYANAAIYLTISSNINYEDILQQIPEDTVAEFKITEYYSITLSQSVQVQIQPKNGTILLVDEEKLIYTPNSNFNGIDSYSVLIMDSGNVVRAFVIVITVTPVDDAPVAVGGSIEIPFPTSSDFVILPTVNDYNIDDQDGFMFTSVVIPLCDNTDPSARCYFLTNEDDTNIIIHINGAIPQPGYSFDIRYKLKEINSVLESNEAVFRVTLTTMPPIVLIREYAVSVMEDENLRIDIIRENIEDRDNPSQLVITQILNSPILGIAIIDDNTIAYTPSPNINGDDVFGYIVSDGVNTVQGSIIVTIIPVNDPPVTPDFSITVPQNSVNFPIVLPIYGMYDPDMNDALDYTIATPPGKGSAVLEEVLGEAVIFYTPNVGFFGIDTIDYIVTDREMASNMGTITLIVEQQTVSPSETPSGTPAGTPSGTPSVSATLEISLISILPTPDNTVTSIPTRSGSASKTLFRSTTVSKSASSLFPSTSLQFSLSSTASQTVSGSNFASMSRSVSSSSMPSRVQPTSTISNSVSITTSSRPSTSNTPSRMPGQILPPLPHATTSTGFASTVPTPNNLPSIPSQLLPTPLPSVSNVVFVKTDNTDGEVVILPGDPLASSLIKTRRLTDVVNIMLIDRDGNEIQPKRAEICFSNTGISDSDIKDSCLSSFNEKKGKWQCDDPCLNNKQDRVCGTVEHFTNFAILLRGGGSDKNDPCSSYPYILGSSEYDMALILSCVGAILIIGIIFIILTMFVKPVQSFVYGNETQRVRKLRNLSPTSVFSEV